MWCSGVGTSPVPRAAVLTPGSRCTTVRRLDSACRRAPPTPCSRSASAASSRGPRPSPTLPPPPPVFDVGSRARPAEPPSRVFPSLSGRGKCSRGSTGAGRFACVSADEVAAPQPAAPATCYSPRALRLGRKLLRAACRGRVRALRRLVGAGADVNFSSCGRTTALFCAAQRGHADVVCFLLNRGAEVDARTSCGVSALHAAAYHDYRGRVTDFLVAGGADVNARDRAGRTPLHLAAEVGNATMVKKLLAAGANRKTKDAGGNTPYQLARSPYVRYILKPPLSQVVKCRVDSERANPEHMVKTMCIIGRKAFR